jgi:large subunit ribosomal protein L13
MRTRARQKGSKRLIEAADQAIEWGWGTHRHDNRKPSTTREQTPKISWKQTHTVRGLIDKPKRAPVHFASFSQGIPMKTYTATPSTVKRDWFVVDATDKVLGRLASEIARRLRGKHKPEFTPSFDTGDYIIVLNAGKVRVTGNKLHDKFYHDHSGYPGGMKSKSFEKLNERHPGEALERAVKGMLPKGPLGRAMFRKMKVYTGAEHNHAAQQPQPLEI